MIYINSHNQNMFRTYVFLLVGSINFVCLQRSHAQLSLLSLVFFFDQTPENHKDKGRPRGRFHSDAQVSIGLGNTKGKL